MNCPCVAAGAVTAPIATENYWQQTVWQTAGAAAAAAPHLMYENIYLIAKLQNNGPFTVPIFTRFGAWQFFFYFFNYFQLWWEYSEIQPVHGSVIIVSNDRYIVVLFVWLHLHDACECISGAILLRSPMAPHRSAVSQQPTQCTMHKPPTPPPPPPCHMLDQMADYIDNSSIYLRQ